MAGTKILVLGGTGPSGINVLRELIHRKLSAVVYARNPSKIPDDIRQNSYIEVIQGGFSSTDEPALSRAISQCSAIISLLGPNMGSIKGLTPTFYADVYSQHIFPLMRQHSVKRILVMNTVSVYQPDDASSFLRWLAQLAVWMAAGIAQKNMYAIEKILTDKEQSKDIDWICFRLGFIPGGSDEQSWRKDREGDVYAGPVGTKDWSIWIKRAQLAKWLVDAAEGGAQEFVHRMPAVGRLAGNKNKTQ